MRKSRLSAFVLAASLAYGGAWAAETVKKAGPEEKLSLDTKESVIKWTGKKVTGQHNGRVGLKSGGVVFKGGELTGGSFEADMTTITVDDLKDPGYNAKLTGHLNSADFFETEKHPTASFKTTKVTPKPGAAVGQPTHDITGDLTIKGITHPVSFPVRVEKKAGRAEAKGTMTVDRTLYNIKYGSGKFFQGLGDKAIHDEFTLELELVAK